MSNLPEVYLLQATKKHLELAKRFQDDMGNHFFEHTMFDVKDALTSILALCDMEDMKQLPQVKKYIQRIVDLLHDVRQYQSGSLFNINHVLINVINVMKNKYKSKIHINHSLSFIKASVKSNKSHLEQLLLYSLIEAVESSQDHVTLHVELSQKERDAVVILRLEGFKYSAVARKEINDFYDASAFRMQMGEQNDQTELVIRLPLSFEVREKETDDREPSASLTVRDIRLADKRSRASSRHSENEEGKQKKKDFVYGAQERT